MFEDSLITRSLLAVGTSLDDKLRGSRAYPVIPLSYPVRLDSKCVNDLERTAKSNLRKKKNHDVK